MKIAVPSCQVRASCESVGLEPPFLKFWIHHCTDIFHFFTQQNVFIIACSKATIIPSALWYIVIELLFNME